MIDKLQDAKNFASKFRYVDDVLDDNGYKLTTNLHTIVVGARKKIPLSNGK